MMAKGTTQNSNMFSLKNLMGVKPLTEGVFISFVFIRFFATCLITNTHYESVYPLEFLACGGLLGDVLFFLVSGFVLARQTDEGFFKWWGKRLLRIYPTIILITILFQIIGYFRTYFSITGFIMAYIVPAKFMFAISIVLLYIPFYFVNKIKDKKKFLTVFAGVIVLWLAVYVLAVDKSEYQMNKTGHYMILFLYFSAMMAGAYLRKFLVKSKDEKKICISMVSAVILSGVYLVLNNVVRGDAGYGYIQIIVPITLLIAVSLLGYSFYSLEARLKKLPKRLLSTVNFIATFTLEIYVVQHPIIDAFSGIVFPLNWVLITLSILAAAIILKIVVNFLVNGTKWILAKAKDI